MRTIRLDEEGVEAAALRAAEVLRAGGVILYPTDTLYGLGADALSDEAVAKVKRIKGRDEGKPIHAMVSDIDALERYADIGKDARILSEVFWPGSLTLILDKKPNIKTGIGHSIKTFGARASDNLFCLALARAYKKPYTGTSANRAGEKPERSVGKILAQLGEAARDIDLVIDAGELPSRDPSTVVDISKNTPLILREGAIPAADIWDVLRPGL